MLLDLGCIKYNLEGKFQPPNRFTINHINTDDKDVLKSIVLPEPTNQEEKEGFQEIRNLIKDKSEMFKSVGCFKEYQVHLELKGDARPIIQKPRQIPIHYQDQTKRRLEEFIREDVRYNGMVPSRSGNDFCITHACLSKTKQARTDKNNSWLPMSQ